MSRLKTISDKLDYIAMGKLNAEQMEYICEINQEVNLKNKEIERLNNIINELEKYAGLGEINWEDKYQDIMLSGKGLLNRIKELKGSNSNEQ